MKVRELIQWLGEHNPEENVEIATCSRSDEWYQVYDLQAGVNYAGEPVVVINTD